MGGGGATQRVCSRREDGNNNHRMHISSPFWSLWMVYFVVLCAVCCGVSWCGVIPFVLNGIWSPQCFVVLNLVPPTMFALFCPSCLCLGKLPSPGKGERGAQEA